MPSTHTGTEVSCGIRLWYVANGTMGDETKNNQYVPRSKSNERESIITKNIDTLNFLKQCN
jgi:hypothetical protein